MSWRNTNAAAVLVHSKQRTLGSILKSIFKELWRIDISQHQIAAANKSPHGKKVVFKPEIVDLTKENAASTHSKADGLEAIFEVEQVVYFFANPM